MDPKKVGWELSRKIQAYFSRKLNFCLLHSTKVDRQHNMCFYSVAYRGEHFWIVLLREPKE